MITIYFFLFIICSYLSYKIINYKKLAQYFFNYLNSLKEINKRILKRKVISKKELDSLTIYGLKLIIFCIYQISPYILLFSLMYFINTEASILLISVISLLIYFPALLKP